MDRTKLPWILVAVLGVGAILVAGLLVLPMHRELSKLRDDLSQANETNEKLQKQLGGHDSVRRELEEARAALSSRLEQTEAELKGLQEAQDDLTNMLQKEIQKGQVAIKRAQGELVIDLENKILFESGEAELNDNGKEILRKVGSTFRKLKTKAVQVGGHTDAVPISPKLKDRFSSNWELSTARAVNVVRFLEWDAKIPSKRLIAVGFAHTRPVASNQTNQGRRRNRRIEVRLISMPKS